jgi:hypothetical protein
MRVNSKLKTEIVDLGFVKGAMVERYLHKTNSQCDKTCSHMESTKKEKKK